MWRQRVWWLKTALLRSARCASATRGEVNSMAKRQRAGAVQEAARTRRFPAAAQASWSAIILFRLFVSATFVAISLSTLATDQPQWGQAWSRNMVSTERNLPDSFDVKSGRNIK